MIYSPTWNVVFCSLQCIEDSTVREDEPCYEISKEELRKKWKKDPKNVRLECACCGADLGELP